MDFILGYESTILMNINQYESDIKTLQLYWLLVNLRERANKINRTKYNGLWIKYIRHGKRLLQAYLSSEEEGLHEAP